MYPLPLGPTSHPTSIPPIKVNTEHQAELPELYSSFTLQFSSVAQSCLILCDPMNRSTPGLPVHHQFPESTQTHVHRVDDAIQPSHPLLSPSPPALNFSQHQGLFQWVSSLPSGGQSIGVSALTSVLPMNTQDWSPLGWTGWISSLPTSYLFYTWWCIYVSATRSIHPPTPHHCVHTSVL